ncbi:uncharacterized protein [Physcomitrium patens]|uniref:SH3 domain-containing protein n=1 Tax=Physcomitrium patens TaxID=3218 RepID=A0A2K1K8M1_PHYPA|nr:uncharacterized protein LOC112285612 [Physcomitrium patens]PNR50130.1 hypothetical protein PHYPA_012027 [Physcomitrium patens]|eukprot:XP_024382333.1 uncharacterized protein LOC112285612 [Physcomitrella patens]
MGSQKLLQSRLVVMVAATILVSLLLAETAIAAEYYTKGNVWIRNCDKNKDGHPDYPPNSNNSKCSRLKVVPKRKKVTVYCRIPGECVHGDCYWLYVKYGSTSGWMSDYWVDCGGKVCPVSRCRNV